jgi:hypothetical protein
MTQQLQLPENPFRIDDVHECVLDFLNRYSTSYISVTTKTHECIEKRLWLELCEYYYMKR